MLKTLNAMEEKTMEYLYWSDGRWYVGGLLLKQSLQYLIIR